MKLNIKESERMKYDILCNFSTYYIRIPKHVRQMYNIQVGSYLNFKGKNNTVIPLQVYKSTCDDYDKYSCRVSPKIFKLIDIDADVVQDITIGCDPELFLVDKNGKCICADKYFYANTDLGYDGPMMEIRPQYTLDPVVLSDHIKNLLHKARLHINEKDGHNTTRMVGASFFDIHAAGFHIHLGLPQDLLIEGMGKKPKIINEIVQILDYFVGMLGVLSENEKDSIRRSSPYVSYGKPGNYRIDRNTLEYRVPGGALLKTPEFTKGILSISILVIDDILKRIKEGSNNIKDIYKIPDSKEVIDSICAKKNDRAMHHSEVIYKKISNMYKYKYRKEEIDMYYNCINNNIVINNQCIDSNWRIQ